jgi:hypothetical protein
MMRCEICKDKLYLLTLRFRSLYRLTPVQLATNQPGNHFFFGVQFGAELHRPYQKNGIVRLPIRFDTPGTHAFN